MLTLLSLALCRGGARPLCLAVPSQAVGPDESSRARGLSRVEKETEGEFRALGPTCLLFQPSPRPCPFLSLKLPIYPSDINPQEDFKSIRYSNYHENAMHPVNTEKCRICTIFLRLDQPKLWSSDEARMSFSSEGL